MKKTIVFEQMEMAFLKGWVEDVVLTQMADGEEYDNLITEVFVVTEFYERTMKSFLFIKRSSRFQIKTSEALSLVIILSNTRCNDDLTDIIRNQIISKIKQKFSWP